MSTRTIRVCDWCRVEREPRDFESEVKAIRPVTINGMGDGQTVLNQTDLCGECRGRVRAAIKVARLGGDSVIWRALQRIAEDDDE